MMSAQAFEVVVAACCRRPAQQTLYFFPLPQGQGAFRAVVIDEDMNQRSPPMGAGGQPITKSIVISSRELNHKTTCRNHGNPVILRILVQTIMKAGRK
jgi:hypothetical protein